MFAAADLMFRYFLERMNSNPGVCIAINSEWVRLIRPMLLDSDFDSPFLREDALTFTRLIRHAADAREEPVSPDYRWRGRSHCFCHSEVNPLTCDCVCGVELTPTVIFRGLFDPIGSVVPMHFHMGEMGDKSGNPVRFITKDFRDFDY
jgi:hypothetical protein